MSSPFVAEIKMFAGNFAPTGWAQCDGQLMPISQNTALFSLLGTFYGGDGKSTFAIPNLQGSAPIHQGQGPGLTDRFLGESGGQQAVTLLPTEMPIHTHAAQADVASTNRVASPSNATWTKAPGRTPPPLYSTSAPTQQMNPLALSITGSSLPHNNMPPYLCLTFIIALQGVFPPRA
jgi:microcystin-dependent protein